MVIAGGFVPIRFAISAEAIRLNAIMAI